MALVTKTIANLINGISQQPPTIRQPTQGEIVENMYGTVYDGNNKRPGSKWLNKYTASNTYGLHPIVLSDGTEWLTWIDSAGRIRVVDTLTGTLQSITAPNGYGYCTTLGGPNPFKMITVADTTYVLNTDIIAPSSTLSLSPVRDPEAFVWVKTVSPAGSPGIIFKITLDGVSATVDERIYTAGTSWGTSDIANSLRTNLIAALGGSASLYTLTVSESYLYIKRVNNADFTVKAHDTKGDTCVAVIKGETKNIEDLPVNSYPGVQIKITGEDGNTTDDYYVVFQLTDPTATVFGRGVWRETLKGGIKTTYGINNMPWRLYMNAGVWTFDRIPWVTRVVGDDVTNPFASVFDRQLTDIFFYKDRLGLVSGPFVSLSRAGDYYNFFCTTVITYLDTNPISITIDSAEGNDILHALPTEDGTILFTATGQFILKGGDIFSGKTAQARKATSFPCSSAVTPRQLGKNTYFVSKDTTSNYHQVKEFYLQQLTDTRDVADITSHCPQYLKSTSTRNMRMAVCQQEDLIFIWDKDAYSIPDTNAQLGISAWVYKFFWNGDQKLQSNWSKFVFDQDHNALQFSYLESATFLGAKLYLLFSRDDFTHLEVIDFAPPLFNPLSPSTGTIDSQFFRLDRRVSSAICTPIIYSSGPNSTDFTLPFESTGTYRAVRYDGVELPCTTLGNIVTVQGGNFTGVSIILGQEYNSKYRFSQQFVRDQTSAPLASPRLQYGYWNLFYDKTGYFQVTVTPANRAAFTYTFGPLATLGSGRFRFPVLCQNNEVTVEINSTHWLPCKFLSVEYEARFDSNYGRLP